MKIIKEKNTSKNKKLKNRKIKILKIYKTFDENTRKPSKNEK